MMRAAISCLLAASLWASSVHGQSPPPSNACGPLQFADEVLSGSPRTQLCPRPIDATLELLSAKLDRAAVKDSSAFFEVLRELRDHSHASGDRSPSDWRALLAEHIDQVLAQAKAEQKPLAKFAAVRGVEADLDPDACLFMTGDAGQPDYACYVVAGTPKPQTKPSLQVLELASYDEAYLAYRALGIAYAAIVKLDLPSLDRALQRLELAEQRWNNLRKRGYLQYPWELALSSVLASYRDYQACFAVDAYCSGEEGLDPERMRLIALHPGVGMGFSGLGGKSDLKPAAKATLALSVELIGLTFYADDLNSYFGASLGAIVNNGNFADIRPGVFVHVTRWLHVGYLMSVFQNSTRYDATLFVSSDLATAFGADFFE